MKAQDRNTNSTALHGIMRFYADESALWKTARESSGQRATREDQIQLLAGGEIAPAPYATHENLPGDPKWSSYWKERG